MSIVSVTHVLYVNGYIVCLCTNEVNALSVMYFTGAPDIFCVYSGLGQGDLALVLG